MTVPPATPLPASDPCHWAMAYGRKLLAEVGEGHLSPHLPAPRHPAQRWADSGLMALTGERNGEPALCPVPLPDCADGALGAFTALSGATLPGGRGGAELLTERAALAGLERNGPLSPQGHCRLLASADGVIALNLARADDWELLPAWLGDETVTDDGQLAGAVRNRATAPLLDQGRLLGLAVADATEIPHQPAPWFQVCHRGTPAPPPRPDTRPTVVDLSSLWAGPLCSHLWQRAGARVIKVESTRRPDGARLGAADFFRLLNQGKRTLAVDFASRQGQRQLAELIESADIILEASRPRALRQMGMIAEDLVARFPGKTWVSITGHGRAEPRGQWIAYGDDAGVAAGLSALLHQGTGRWLLCGDAIADPLTGIHAALAGWASWLKGGGEVIALALADVVRHCVTATAPGNLDYAARYRAWHDYLAEHQIPCLPPRRAQH